MHYLKSSFSNVKVLWDDLLSLLRLDSNALAVSEVLTSGGKLFQSLTVERRNELKDCVVRASIV